jgi:hypothetical protein
MFTAYPVFSIFSSVVSEYIGIQLCAKTREFRVGRLGQSRFRVANSEKRGGILFAADSPSYHRWQWNKVLGEFHEPSNHLYRGDIVTHQSESSLGGLETRPTKSVAIRSRHLVTAFGCGSGKCRDQHAPKARIRQLRYAGVSTFGYSRGTVCRTPQVPLSRPMPRS